MESEFQKMRKEIVKNQKNMVLLEVAIYIIAIFILFGLGGKIEYLSTMRVPLISIDGIIKIFAIISFLILVAIIFVPGPVIVMRDIATYLKIRGSD